VTVTTASATIAITAAAKIITWREVVASATKRIEAFFADIIPLIPAPAAPSIVTHNFSRTLSHRSNKLASKACQRQPHFARDNTEIDVTPSISKLFHSVEMSTKRMI